MGGGGLVILRHKSWHVWNQDNVERVLVDEAAQREEQEELRETQFARDAQARHDVLQNRSRARVRKQANRHGIALDQVIDHQPVGLEVEMEALKALPQPKNDGHINLFAEEEHSQRLKEEKEAAEKGKRKRKEMGPAVVPDEVFRGADKDSRGFVPWYTTGAEENSQVDNLVQTKKEAKGAKKRLRGPGLTIDMKTLEDPLTAMNSMLSSKARSEPLRLEMAAGGARDSPSSSPSRSRSRDRVKKEKKKKAKAQEVVLVDSDSDEQRSKKKKHKHKKENKKSHKKDKKDKKDHKEQAELMEALRRGRLEREQEEKRKAQALLLSKR